MRSLEKTSAEGAFKKDVQEICLDFLQRLLAITWLISEPHKKAFRRKSNKSGSSEFNVYNKRSKVLTRIWQERLRSRVLERPMTSSVKRAQQTYL